MPIEHPYTCMPAIERADAKRALAIFHSIHYFLARLLQRIVKAVKGIESVGKCGMEVAYDTLLKIIVKGLRKATKTLKELGYESQNISPREFYDYMTGETPTGDAIIIVDVLNNVFLMIHEVVEISELKKMRIPINKRTVVMFHPKVYEAHYTATEYELDHALNEKNYDWLKVRVNNAKSWLEDDSMPPHLVPRCKAIIEKFSEVLPKGA